MCIRDSFYTERAGTLMHVTIGGLPRTVGVIVKFTVNLFCRKHYCFIIPVAEYSRDSLPKQAM